MKQAARNNVGQFVSIEQRLLTVAFMLATVVVSGALVVSSTEKPKLTLIVPVVAAKEVPTPVKDVSKIPRVTIAGPFSIEDKIRAKFGAKADIMLAIARPESGLNPRNQGWNCFYDINGNWKAKRTEKTDVSKGCKEKDRYRSWSTDCGVFQINHPGTVCPEKLFEVDHNLNRAKEKLESQGFSAWSVYNSGIYKKYL